MKPIRALVEAQDELSYAASFYDSQRAGLGQVFLRSIDKAVEEICEHPGRWPMIGKGIRRRLVGRFPLPSSTATIRMRL
jgi:hypothetical protein